MRQFNTLLKQAELLALNAHIKEAAAAQAIWAIIVPENLVQFSHARSIKNKQLMVHADNNAVAAKIKLLIPSLLIQLKKQGCEVTAIQVKVQVKSSPTTPLKPSKNLSAHAAVALNQLANKLTGTPLGEALARLATKSK